MSPQQASDKLHKTCLHGPDLLWRLNMKCNVCKYMVGHMHSHSMKCEINPLCSIQRHIISLFDDYIKRDELCTRNPLWIISILFTEKTWFKRAIAPVY